MTKTLVAIGDTHIGNQGAVMPLEVHSEEVSEGRNNVYMANAIQRKLLKKWEEMCDDYPKPDVLLINGDLIDGKNYKDSGLGVWTTDVDLQAKTLSDLVGMMKPKKIIATSGSPYHSERNPNMDKRAVEYCGGVFKGGYASLSVGGVRFHAQHKVSVSKSTWQYRSTPVGRAMVLAALTESDYGHYHVILKSHAHYFAYVGYSNSLGVILPCQKAFDSFGDTNIEFNNPSMGYCVFECDNGEYSWIHNVFHFKQKILNPDVVV